MSSELLKYKPAAPRATRDSFVAAFLSVFALVANRDSQKLTLRADNYFGTKAHIALLLTLPAIVQMIKMGVEKQFGTHGFVMKKVFHLRGDLRDECQHLTGITSNQDNEVLALFTLHEEFNARI